MSVTAFQASADGGFGVGGCSAKKARLVAISRANSRTNSSENAMHPWRPALLTHLDPIGARTRLLAVMPDLHEIRARGQKFHDSRVEAGATVIILGNPLRLAVWPVEGHEDVR